MYVKNSDTREELNHILYDPGTGSLGSGELFKGWLIVEPDEDGNYDSSYTTEDVSKAKTIDEIREWAFNRQITEGDLVKIYAMVFKTYSVTFKDEDSATVHTEALICAANDASIDYTINVQYTPKTIDQEFQGWYPTPATSANVEALDGTNPPYDNSTEVSIKGNVVFTAQAPKGYWISFVANGGTYTSPVFVETGHKTVAPDDPTRTGYKFDGWYKDKELTEKFEFGSVLDPEKSTALYAKWVAEEKAEYKVIIWMQNTEANNYDYGETIELIGSSNSIIDTVEEAGDGTDKYAVIDSKSKEYKGFYLKKYDQNVTINPDGTTILNVYYDRKEITYTFHRPGTPPTAQYGRYGYVDGKYVQLYYRRNNWNYPEVGNNDDHDTVYYYVSYGWTGEYVQYTGDRYSTNTAPDEVLSYSGPYGTAFKDWPEPGENYVWQERSRGMLFPLALTEFKPEAALEPDTTLTTVEFDLTSFSKVSELTVYKQTEQGEWKYNKDYTIATAPLGGGGVWYPTETYTGFKISGYRLDNTQGSWTEVTNDGRIQYVESGYTYNYYHDVFLRYTRDKFKIAYMDGVYVDGDGGEIDETTHGQWRVSDEIYYEQNISDYPNEGDNYIPVRNGYSFDGWYKDPGCSQKYEFTTMPLNGITVYAKWVKIQYRVFLHPNVPQGVTDFVWDDPERSTSFRIDYESNINNGNMIDADVTGDYDLIGWYMDEACTKPFNFEAYILNNTTTTAYDKEHEYTERDKYGKVVEEINKDKDRHWITRKLDLYAKWRKTIPDAPGINIQYDAVEGEGYFEALSGEHQVIYIDPLTYYLDEAESTATAASIPEDPDKKQFLYWVLQKWDGNSFVDTSVHVYPGDAFIVLKDDARVVDINNDDVNTPEFTKQYIVQLRAEYGDKDAPTPTHIYWYANNDSVPDDGDQYMVKTVDPGTNSEYLEINKGFDIKPADQFSYKGYKFLGWARVTEPENTVVGNTERPDHPELTEDDLYIKWDSKTRKYLAKENDSSTKFTVEVSQVAADEKQPYHDMYAVWQPMKKLTITKKLGGSFEYIDIPEEGFSVELKFNTKNDLSDIKIPDGKDEAGKDKYLVPDEDGTVTVCLKPTQTKTTDSIEFYVLPGTELLSAEEKGTYEGIENVVYKKRIGSAAESEYDKGAITLNDNTEIIITNEAAEIIKTGLDIETSAMKTALLSLFAFAMMCALGFSLKRRYVSRR